MTWTYHQISSMPAISTPSFGQLSMWHGKPGTYMLIVGGCVAITFFTDHCEEPSHVRKNSPARPALGCVWHGYCGPSQFELELVHTPKQDVYLLNLTDPSIIGFQLLDTELGPLLDVTDTASHVMEDGSTHCCSALLHTPFDLG